MDGWIKDHRKELESNIWLMPPLYHRVWQWLKYRVNHKENAIPMQDGTSFTIKPGQHLTSIRSIATGVGWWEGRVWKEPNPRTIMKILKWLESQEMISVDNGRGNRQYTFVTIEKWALYQGQDDEGVTGSTPRSTTDRTTESKQTVQQTVHINKNDKNEKNDTRMKKNEKKAYAEFVSLLPEEYQKLVDAHGKELTLKMIEILDNYKGANGKKYKSDYRAILNWVVDRAKKESPQKSVGPKSWDALRALDEKYKNMEEKHEP